VNITNNFRIELLEQLNTLRGKLEDELERGIDSISYNAQEQYRSTKLAEIKKLDDAINALEHPLVNFVSYLDLP